MKTIFVSSTFIDMQEERNIIHTHVMPDVNFVLKEKGDYANFLDFRWGIDTKGLTEDSALKKVLSACFDAINNSEYFVVFIGNHYGSCVPQLIMNELEKQHHFIHNDISKSITELEIEFAVFNNKISTKNILFYFKDTPDQHIDERVEVLKRNIEKRYPSRIRHYYTTDEVFSKQLSQDILCWFDQSEPLSYDVSSHINADYLQRFSCRHELLTETLDRVLEEPLTIVHGESGCGKTVFMSALENGLSQKCHTNIQYANESFFPHHSILKILWNFIGYTVINDYPTFKLNQKCFGSDYENQIMALFSIINDAPDIKEFVFLIDGIDKLSSTQVTEILSVLKNYSPKLHFVISLDNPEKYIYSLNQTFVFLDRLSDDDKKRVITKELSFCHKVLPEIIIDRLIQKKDSGLPLYLVLSIRRLVHMQKADYSEIYNKEDFSDSFNNHIIGIIQDYSDDIENMIIDYIEFSERIIEKEEAINIVSFLAASSYGFTETELYFLIEKHHVAYLPVLFIGSDDLFKYKESDSFRDNSPLRNIAGSPLYTDFNVAEFYLFYKYLGDLLNVNPYNGKMFFDNTIVKKAIVELYHGEIILDAISNEIFYDDKDRVLSDYEICNCILRTTFVKSYIVNPYRKEINRRYIYPPFYIIFNVVKNKEENQIELLSSILFDLLAIEGANILKSYLAHAFSLLKKHKYAKEEVLLSVQFLMKNIFPKVFHSMLNPIDYVSVFDSCLAFLRKHMDFSIIDNRLYIIMSRLNIAIMCYRSGYSEVTYTISKQCKSHLNAVPFRMRNELYYDAKKTLDLKLQEWGFYNEKKQRKED